MNCVCGRQDKPHLILDGRVVKRLVPMDALLMFPGAGVDGSLTNDLEFVLFLLHQDISKERYNLFIQACLLKS